MYLKKKPMAGLEPERPRSASGDYSPRPTMPEYCSDKKLFIFYSKQRLPTDRGDKALYCFDGNGKKHLWLSYISQWNIVDEVSNINVKQEH